MVFSFKRRGNRGLLLFGLVALKTWGFYLN